MTHDQIDDLRSSLKKLSYYCFDAESISLCAWYFAACGKSDIVGEVEALLKTCRHSADLWSWMYHRGIFDDRIGCV
jgi:hypothetical protein